MKRAGARGSTAHLIPTPNFTSLESLANVDIEEKEVDCERNRNEEGEEGSRL